MTKTLIAATFSNGHTDTYKGKRPVKAGWMVVLPCGSIVSGHSQDAATAGKTARAAAATHFRDDRFYYMTLKPRGAVWAGRIQFMAKTARELGFASYQAHDAARSAAANAFVSSCKIEVVGL